MNAVTDLLANDGLPLNQIRDEATPPQRGIRFAVKLIFLSILLAPLCVGMSFAKDTPVPLFAPLTVFLAGLLWLAYTRMFGEEPVPQGRSGRAEPAILHGARTPLLSAPHTLSGSPTRAADTGEMLAPPAITDHTTRLLD